MITPTIDQLYRIDYSICLDSYTQVKQERFTDLHFNKEERDDRNIGR